MTRPRLTMKEALAEVIEPFGKTIVDVGCGDGAIVRHLARSGANAIGIEVSDAQLERARAKPAGDETYRVGRGESLPFADGSVDVVLYLNSLHHLPPAVMEDALAEAARVLKKGGQLIAVEPLAEGNYFEAMRPIEDETEICSLAYATLLKGRSDLTAEGELIYETIVRLRDADHFLQAVTAPDPARRERLPQVEAELRKNFQAYAQRDAEGPFLSAPMRRNLFRKTG